MQNNIELFFSFCEARLYELEGVGIYTVAISFHQILLQNKSEALIDFISDNPHVELIIRPGGAEHLRKRAAELGTSVFLIPEYIYLKTNYRRFLEKYVSAFRFVVEFSMDTTLEEYLEYTKVERVELESIVGADKLCPVWQKHHRLATWDELCKTAYPWLAVGPGEGELVAKRKISAAHRHNKKIYLLNSNTPKEMGTRYQYDAFSSGYWRSGNTFSKVFTIHTGKFKEIPQSAISTLFSDQKWRGWFDKYLGLMVDKGALEAADKATLDIYNAVVWQGYLQGTLIPAVEDRPKQLTRGALNSIIRVDQEGKILRYTLVETQQGDIIRRNDLLPDNLPFESLAGAAFHKVDPILDMTVPTSEEGEGMPMVHEMQVLKKYQEFASKRALIQLREKGAVALMCDTCQMGEHCPKKKPNMRCALVFGQDQEMQLHDTMDILAQQQHITSDALKMISRGLAENITMDGGQFDPSLMKEMGGLFKQLGNLREAHDTELKGAGKRGKTLDSQEAGGVMAQMIREFAAGAAKPDGTIVDGKVVEEGK